MDENRRRSEIRRMSGRHNSIACFHNVGYEQDAKEGYDDHVTQLKVVRPCYIMEELNLELNYRKPKTKVTKRIKKKITSINPLEMLLKAIPILAWLPHYSFRKDLIGDLISGVTVAVMHIPQGIAYSLLANVPPVTGIYTAFFPVIIYIFFGTSKHNSMGTFAVLSIMVGNAVQEYSNVRTNLNPAAVNSTLLLNVDVTVGPAEPNYSPVEIATALCFLCGLWHILMCVFRLGIVASLLSETLVSGFTTGAAIHVLTSQIKDLLGLKLPPVQGYFDVIKTFIEIFKAIFDNQMNGVVILLSAGFIIILVINNDFIKPYLSKRCPLPIPIELLIVILGVVISMFIDNDKLGVTTIGAIPTGLPIPRVPNFSLFSTLLVESFVMAIVSYTISVSMGLILATKDNYEINFNQELWAMGSSNIFGSFFSCMPFCASLSRSYLQQLVGGRTQLTSLVSCSILVVVLLVIAPFFEPLPRCALASIIVVSLKGLLLQVKQFVTFFRLSGLDATVWLGTFLTVVFVAIDIGLLVGVLLSISSIFLRGMKPYSCLLGNMPDTDLYLDIKRYEKAVQIPNIKIFHYCGSLNFASRNSFKNDLHSSIGLDFAKELKRLTKNPEKPRTINYNVVIIDFSALSYIDASGASYFKILVKDLNRIELSVFLAACSCPVFEMMNSCHVLDALGEQFNLFPTVHDAVLYAKSDRTPDKLSVISVPASSSTANAQESAQERL